MLNKKSICCGALLLNGVQCESCGADGRDHTTRILKKRIVYFLGKHCRAIRKMAHRNGNYYWGLLKFISDDFVAKTIPKEEAQKELDEMIKIYKQVFNGRSAFLVGSSLVGNKQGDSARYWELRKILDK